MKLWHIVGLVTLLGLGIAACDKDDSSNTLEDIHALVPEVCVKDVACFDDCESSDDPSSCSEHEMELECQQELLLEIGWLTPGLSNKCIGHLRDFMECPLDKNCDDLVWREDRQPVCEDSLPDECLKEIERYYIQQPEFDSLLTQCLSVCAAKAEAKCPEDELAPSCEDECVSIIAWDFAYFSSPACLDVAEKLYTCEKDLSCDDLENDAGCEEQRAAFETHCW